MYLWSIAVIVMKMLRYVADTLATNEVEDQVYPNDAEQDVDSPDQSMWNMYHLSAFYLYVSVCI